MISDYKKCITELGSKYMVLREVNMGNLYKVAPGVYSDSTNVSELEILLAQYPEATFTSSSAYFYHGLTDSIPEKFNIASVRDTSKIKKTNIQQHFYPAKIFAIGIEEMPWENATIKLYDKERMLIELVRHKNKMPFDLYKEIVSNYRNISTSLDSEKLADYIQNFPAANKIAGTIQLEVY